MKYAITINIINDANKPKIASLIDNEIANVKENNKTVWRDEYIEFLSVMRESINDGMLVIDGDVDETIHIWFYHLIKSELDATDEYRRLLVSILEVVE